MRDGVPPDLRTIVVVPTLLVHTSAIEKQIERLEVHHLSSPDDNFVFALLSDWNDSAAERDADDESLLDEAAAGIARLNARYPAEGGAHVSFFFIAGVSGTRGRECGSAGSASAANCTSSTVCFAALPIRRSWPSMAMLPALPSGIRYVITLDADTRLPIGAARRLVGKIAHPSTNLASISCRRGREGHGILQPRVTPSLPIGSEGSLFQRAFSGPNGLDPYALAVSDVYQDMFEEGSYCGKGIYEIESFEAALEGQIPENSVLSHDLLEGIFARAGLVSDIEVVEEFPSRYDVVGGAPASLGAGRLAVVALDFRLSFQE